MVCLTPLHHPPTWPLHADPPPPSPLLLPHLGPDSLLGVADDELKILSQTDRLPEAPLVANHESVRGTVEKDAYKYFKLKVEGKQSVVKIKLAALHGDPDVRA